MGRIIGALTLFAPYHIDTGKNLFRTIPPFLNKKFKKV
jgi:hypothetical protein